MTQVQPQLVNDPVLKSPHERWIQSTGVPIHRGYFIDDVRSVEVGPWAERECNAAFLQLAGQEGVTEARVTEIPPGKTLPPMKFALDEAVYVAEGRGLTTIWNGEGNPKKTFEWQKHSVFLLPHSSTYQLTNTQGDRAVRLLNQNFLPLAMQTLANPDFYFKNPFEDPAVLYGEEGEFYAEARAVEVTPEDSTGWSQRVWQGNFFPDMRAWDKIVPYYGRGAGGHFVAIQFPGSETTAHMSIFPSRTYKKAHRHGPGVLIVIPAGEGYSVMWVEGKEKVFIPWHEGSVLVPPDQWFHQHFNVGAEPARYLAFHSPRGINRYSESVEDLARNQIEYPDEDPHIRQTFAAELAKRGLESLMPEEAYGNRDFEWDYGNG